MGPEGGLAAPCPVSRPLSPALAPCPALGRGVCGKHAEGSPGVLRLSPSSSSSSSGKSLAAVNVPVQFDVLNVNILLDKSPRGIKTSITLHQTRRFQCVFLQSVVRGSVARLQNNFFP